MKAHIRAALAASERKHARITPIALAKPRNLWMRMSEEEAHAVLAKFAPNWEDHLFDGGVIDRILDGLAGL